MNFCKYRTVARKIYNIKLAYIAKIKLAYIAKKALVQSQTSPCQICGGRQRH